MTAHLAHTLADALPSRFAEKRIIAQHLRIEPVMHAHATLPG